ncbi:MAG: cytochrome c3 family protein [Candidatus Sulfotelmatobacter sp.]
MTVSARFMCRALLPFLVGSCVCHAGSHPVRIDQNSNCLECHADHATGDHIHPAVTLGCSSCHSIDNREDASYVALKPTKGVACFQCHDPASFLNPHLPYASGMCMRCHNPHHSANPRLLRAKVNELCLSCHLRTKESVPSRYMPLIELTANNSMGHPYLRHPVSGSHDALNGGEMSCTSCHHAHGGTQAHLLKSAAEIPEDALNHDTETKDLCRQCHLRMWGLDGSGSGKKGKKRASWR